MAFALPALPFAREALEPIMSANTLSFHYDKHHQAYVTNLNNLLKGTPMGDLGLSQVIKACKGDPSKTAVFNNAAQVWNHTFFWHSLKKPSSSPATVPGELEKRVISDFGSVEKFKEDFVAAGIAQFGSGWAWLVEEGGKLKITKTANADLPMVHGQKALLTCDVWEHAYYLDYQNRRPDFLKAFVTDLINWEFAAANLAADSVD